LSNRSESLVWLLRCLKARVPLITIRTIEPSRARDMVRDAAGELRALTFYEHSRTEGTRELLSGQVTSDEGSLPVALEYARSVFKARENANFVFTDVEDVDSETSTARHFAEMARLAESRVGSIIMITAKPLWTGLSRLGMNVSLDLPDQKELEDEITDLVETNRGYLPVSWERQHVRQAAEILSGVTLLEATNILATVMASGELNEGHLKELSHFKDQIFGDLNGIERVPLREDYKVGGLNSLKEWLSRRRNLMSADLTHTTVSPPRGVLLVGVSGCGKSLSAKAIAQEWQLPLYRLDMAAVLGMYVGQSEGQLREALETAERMAPCVLWVDEIEKALVSGAGDGGTSRRLVGQFLYWLQEHTAKVFLVATANDVTSLPPELLRKGRFDEMFFVDLPDAHDREEIVVMYFRKRLEYDVPPDLLRQLVDLSEGFTGSDLEAVIRDITLAKYNSGRLPADADIKLHFTNLVPFSKTNAEELGLTRAWGLTRCVPAGTPRGPLAEGETSGNRRVVLL
jgi:hypothetical protein